MKSATAWCVAIGLLSGTNLSPPAFAQDSQNTNQQPGQDHSNRQEQVQGQPQDPKRNPQPTTRQWNQQGPRRELFQWNQQLHANNYPSGWHFLGGPNGGGLLLGSGAPQDLVLAAPDAALREHLDLHKDQGVVVTSVDPNSSAARAGIQQNDILLSLGEHALAKPEDLFDRLKEVGEKPVSLTLLRAGSRKKIQVQAQIRVFLNPVAATTAPREYWIGIAVATIPPVLRAQLGLTQPHAVIVNQVVAGSPAANAGIALHDIILSVDGKKVMDPNDIAKTVQAKAGKAVALEVIGKGAKPRTVSVSPERKKITQTSPAQPGSNPGVAAYDFISPGAVLEGYYTNLYSLDQPHQFEFNTTFLQPNQIGVEAKPPAFSTGADQKTQAAGPDLAKRLDTLDSDLKELRKLVEELQKTATRIIEREKSDNDTTSKQ